MACMGPFYDEKLAKVITEDFLTILREKYKIGNNGLDKPNATLAWGKGERTVEFDDGLKMELLTVIEEIVKSDAFNGW